MSDLVFIAFPSEQKADEVRARISEVQKDYLIELGDAVVAVKDARRPDQAQSDGYDRTGALSGAFGALLSASFSLAARWSGHGRCIRCAWRQSTDVGINDQFMKDAAGALKPGTAGLFLLIRKMTGTRSSRT